MPLDRFDFSQPGWELVDGHWQNPSLEKRIAAEEAAERAAAVKREEEQRALRMRPQQAPEELHDLGVLEVDEIRKFFESMREVSMDKWRQYLQVTRREFFLHRVAVLEAIVLSKKGSIRRIAEAKKEMEEENSKLSARIEALEASIKQLESRGASAITIEQRDDLRTFTIRQGDTRQSFYLPVLVYKGVHRAGVEYQMGDVVTHDGSAWHCKRDTILAPPGPDWQLMVKRGRDAKGGL